MSTIYHQWKLVSVTRSVCCSSSVLIVNKRGTLHYFCKMCQKLTEVKLIKEKGGKG